MSSLIARLAVSAVAAVTRATAGLSRGMLPDLFVCSKAVMCWLVLVLLVVMVLEVLEVMVPLQISHVCGCSEGSGRRSVYAAPLRDLPLSREC